MNGCRGLRRAQLSPIFLIGVAATLSAGTLSCGRDHEEAAPDKIGRSQQALSTSTITIKLKRLYIGQFPDDGAYRAVVDFQATGRSPIEIWSCPQDPPLGLGSFIPFPEGQSNDGICDAPGTLPPGGKADIVALAPAPDRTVYTFTPPAGVTQVPVQIRFVHPGLETLSFLWQLTIDASTGLITFNDQQERAHAESVGNLYCARNDQDWMLCWEVTLDQPNPFTISRNFSGITALNTVPPASLTGIPAADASGAVGPNHFFQVVNTSFSIYDKTGVAQDLNAMVGNPPGSPTLTRVTTGTFWNGFLVQNPNSATTCAPPNPAGCINPCTCPGCIFSDAVVLYDHDANVWVFTRPGADGATGDSYQCIAISPGNDPTAPISSYKRYAFRITTKVIGSRTGFDSDYPKLAVWPDANRALSAYYFVSRKRFTSAGGNVQIEGNFIFAFERAKMLLGQSAQSLAFELDNFLDGSGNVTSRGGMLPADWDGKTLPPSGSPGYFVRPIASEFGWSGADRLEIWKAQLNWTAGTGTLTLADALPTAPFQPACLTNQLCVPQPGSTSTPPTASTLDSLAVQDDPMFRFAYRNFGDHEVLLLNHTVDDNQNGPTTGHVAPRWYELRRSSGAWTIFQQNNYVPDAEHRWFGSIGMDSAGNIALGFNVSGTRFPSIGFGGRLATSPRGQFSPETTIKEGGGVLQPPDVFLSDYSQLTIDPSDDCTFWYTNAYQVGNSTTPNWGTQIASFRSSTCAPAATSIAYTGITTQDFDDIAALSATLVNAFNGTGVARATLTFTIGAQSCSGTTDNNGQAACTVAINQPSGSYPLTVTFAGMEQLAPQSFAGTFTVTREETTLGYTGPSTIARNRPVTLSALLQEDGALPISGRTVQFTIGAGAAAQSCSGATAANGTASCTIANVNQPAGNLTVQAAFAGDAFFRSAAASSVTLLRNAWALGVAYRVGDEVVFNGLIFIARQAHTSRTGWEPPNAFSLWARSKADTNGVWTIQVVYVPGDVVSFEGHHYRALQGGQAIAGWEPPKVPALWTRID